MRAIIFFALLLFSASAYASETITYTYDELGRLVKVAHSGTANNNASSCYSYDRANNRTNYTVQVNSSCTSGGGGGVTLSVNNPSATEGANLTFTVTKSGTAAGTVTVDYATANGTATGSDYTAKSGTLSFLTADTTKTVAVTTTDDATGESSETVLLNLTNPTGGATISDSQGVGTINDNDGTQICSGVSFGVSDASANEGSNLSFTVTKTGTTTDTCNVFYATADGTAHAGTNYSAKSLTSLGFLSGDTSKTVSVGTLVDGAVTGDLTMYLNLSSPTGSATISDSQGVGTIHNTDTSGNQPPVANPDFASVSACGTVTVNVIANDTDPNGNYPLHLSAIVSSTKGHATIVSTTDIEYDAFVSSGTGVVTYTVMDSSGGSSNGTLTITIGGGQCP